MKPAHRITWLTLLSLDAPLVAILWQNAVAERHGLALEWHHRGLVFLAVWLGYSADRWFDAWRHRSNVSPRHVLYAKRRWPFFGFWLTILTGSVAWAFNTLGPSELISGFSLAAASIIITLLIQLNAFGSIRSLAKTILTALLVTGSVLLFSSATLEENLAAAWMLFPLFAFNCSLIHYWDRSLDAIQEPETTDTLQPRSLVFFFILSLVSIASKLNSGGLAAYALLSAFFLVLLHLFRRQLPSETRRTLADIALFTPVLGFFSNDALF